MKRLTLSVLAAALLTACPSPETPKAPTDDPGPADDGGTETGEPPPKPAT